MSFKAKRNRHKVKPGLALPACLSSGAIHKGTYNGMAVEVGNSVAMQDLQENGCFGMSSGGRTTGTTSADDGTGSLTDSTQAKLLLFPEEALFLAHSIKCLEIRNKDDEIMSGEDCLEEFCRIHPEFISSFVAYSYLRSKNWVTKSGIKFGGDFLIYRRGPEFFHASYLVLVQTEGDPNLRPVQLQCIDRVSRTSGKDVLILEVSPRPTSKEPLTIKSLSSNFTITEIIPKRFILK